MIPEAREGMGGPAEAQLGEVETLLREAVLWEAVDDIRPEILEAQGE